MISRFSHKFFLVIKQPSLWLGLSGVAMMAHASTDSANLMHWFFIGLACIVVACAISVVSDLRN